ncbi:hypothetical protein EUGRSUZ_A01655 [Eucalyptus grandis]|uniref:Uncharacterized protein n=2 Tax=Eucalyptus grandis TaxID=71139 RepID=A0ACC3M273_EUCGR|nr:hypothetical protein EUGRSUZ_A01655 [Eucalyptus grandis]
MICRSSDFLSLVHAEIHIRKTLLTLRYGSGHLNLWRISPGCGVWLILFLILITMIRNFFLISITCAR